MYSSSNRSSITVKKYGDHVSVSVVCRNNNSYQVIFYVEKNKKTVSLRKNETEAHRIAKAIAYDLDTGNLSLDDFKPLSGKEILALYQREKSKSKLTLIESVKNSTDNRSLKDIWENYKTAKDRTTPNSTKKNQWLLIDKWLTKCPKILLSIDKTLDFLQWLRTKAINNNQGYSDKSIAPAMRILKASYQLAIDTNFITGKNPLIKVYELLDTKKKKEIKAFTLNDIKVIINAFETNQFLSKNSSYTHNYYTSFIQFRFLTGCRPSEAIALTWGDIKIKANGKLQIIFSKRFSEGELLQGTKNGIDARIFNCNDQLTNFINNLEKIPNENNLIFPSPKEKSYINSRNFTRDIWKPIVSKLYDLGLITVYLPFYDQRHTFGSLAMRHNPDLTTISSLMGNSPKTLINNYLAVDENSDYLPDIY